MYANVHTHIVYHHMILCCRNNNSYTVCCDEYTKSLSEELVINEMSTRL